MREEIQTKLSKGNSKEIEHETHNDKYLDGSGNRWTICSSPFRAE
jgi:hypothetical protein